MNCFSKGDRVIYRREKHSTKPGPRAVNVDPSPLGETYSYEVDKFWLVEDIDDRGQVIVKTRRGKTHQVPKDDPRLRRASWWERWLYSKRFPQTSGPSGV